MSAIGEGADAAAKILSALKDLPLWILVALAAVANVLFFIPVVKGQLPKEFGPWLLVAVVLSNILAISRGISVVVNMGYNFRAARIARRTLHLSPEGGQSFWATIRQKDDSTTTQVVVRFLVKNLTEAPLGLVAVRLIRPKIPGEIVHADVMMRAVDNRMYGTTAHSGHRVPGKEILPATATIIIRGMPKQSPGEILPITLGVMDDEGNEQRLKLRLKGTGLIKPPEQAVHEKQKG